MIVEKPETDEENRNDGKQQSKNCVPVTNGHGSGPAAPRRDFLDANSPF